MMYPARDGRISARSRFFRIAGQSSARPSSSAKKGGKTFIGKGVWATDFSGQPRLVFRTGVPDEIAPGKTLKRFVFLKASTGSTGSTRSFNSKGEIAWLATFTDGTEAIVTTVVP